MLLFFVSLYGKVESMALHRLTARRLTLAESEDLLQQALAVIVQRCDPDAVILFGSAARQEMTDASDLDFVVIIRDQDLLKSSRGNFYSSPRPIRWPMDIIFVSREEYERSASVGGLFKVCRDEGRLMYQRGRKL